MRRIFLFFGILLSILLGLLFFFLKVRTVSCEADGSIQCSSLLFEKLSAFQGNRLFQSERKIRNTLSSEPEVLSYAVKTSPLGDITVRITLREGSIALKPESSNTYTLYTKDGILVKEAAQTSLPTVVLKEQISTEAVPFVAALSYQLTTILPISQMTVEGESLKVVLRDNRILIYPLQGDIDVLLGSTLITFSQLNLTEGKLIIDRQAVVIREIDLRFKNPVLR